MKTYLISVLLVCSFVSASAQQDLPKVQIAEFHRQLCADTEQVITNFINPLTSDTDVIENFRDQFAFLRDNYGDCNGFEVFNIKEYSPSVHLYKCFFKYERTPVIFNFIFYKYKDTWQLNAVNFSDSVASELAKAND